MPTQRRNAPATPPPKPSTDVATTGKGTLTSFIETYEGDFARVMPGHVNVNAFVGLAAAYVRRDDKLRQAAQANPASLILALRECAALGHTPVPKVFALVPFRDNKNAAAKGWGITGIETYHGVIERMYRAGGVVSVHVELVRRNDTFVWSPMEQRVVRHEYDPFATDEDRGDLMGVYAWARLFSGSMSQVVWMNRGEVMKHRAASRSGDAFWGGVWEPSMWKKTAMHQLETYVPTSAEYRWTVALSGSAAASGFTNIPDVPVLDGGYGPSPDDVVDAELVDEPARAAPREQRSAVRGPEPARATTNRPAPQSRPERAEPPAPAADDDETGGADPDTDPQLPEPNPFDKAKSPEEWAAWERQESGGPS